MWNRCFSAESLAGTDLIIVIYIFFKQPFQVALVQRNYMIEKLTAKNTYRPLTNTILPRVSVCDTLRYNVTIGDL